MKKFFMRGTPPPGTPSASALGGAAARPLRGSEVAVAVVSGAMAKENSISGFWFLSVDWSVGAYG